MMPLLKKIAVLLVCTTAFALPASADNTGLSVTATLAFGANGANGGQYWNPQTAIVGNSTEFNYADGANIDTADFTATQLIIRDQVLGGANGWEMTFTTAGGFQSISLSSSNFIPGLTYGITNGKIVIDWVGTDSAPHDYIASFNVSAVPEPETYGMLLAGIAMVGLLSRRRAAAKA